MDFFKYFAEILTSLNKKSKAVLSFDTNMIVVKRRF